MLAVTASMSNKKSKANIAEEDSKEQTVGSRTDREDHLVERGELARRWHWSFFCFFSGARAMASYHKRYFVRLLRFFLAVDGIHPKTQAKRKRSKLIIPNESDASGLSIVQTSSRANSQTASIQPPSSEVVVPHKNVPSAAKQENGTKKRNNF